MATGAFDNTRVSSGLRSRVDGESVGALLLAASIPFLFFHERYQPDFGIGLGATTVDIRLSDLAVMVVLVAAAEEVSLGSPRDARSGSSAPHSSHGSRSRRSVRHRSTTRCSTTTW